MGFFQKIFEILPNFEGVGTEEQKSSQTCLDYECVFLHRSQVFTSSSSHEVHNVEHTDLLEHFGIRIFYLLLKIFEQKFLVSVRDTGFVCDLTTAFFFVFFE